MAKKSATLAELQKKVIAFRDLRDWKQFNNPKDLALSLTLEAAEVLEHFQWKATKEDIDKHIKTHKKEIGEELADVLYWVLAMSHDLGINLKKTFEKKMEKNERKYPIRKAQGRSTKYTNL